MEIFTIKNVSASEITLNDFGMVIPAGIDVDLMDANRAILSTELNTYLQAGTLVRTISGVTVNYQNAFVETPESIRIKNYSTTSGATAPYAKIDITNGNKLVASSDYYGQHYQKYQALASNTMSNTSPMPKIATFFQAPTAGTYKITSTFVWSRSATNSTMSTSLDVDAVTQGTRGTLTMRVANTADINVFNRIYYITLTAGQHTINLNIWNSGGSSTISDAIIEIIRVA